MDDFAVLQSCSLFSSLAVKTLEDGIFPFARAREFARGSAIFAPGERVDELGVIVHGRVQLLHISAEGDCPLLGVLSRGQLLGAELICTRTRTAPYHAIAAAPTRILFLPPSLFLDGGTLDEASRLSIVSRLLTMLSHDSVRKEYRLAILSRRGLRERVLTYLTMQAQKRGAATVTIPFSREELASFLCVNRSALSHELSCMARDGLISFHKNRFTLNGWKPSQGREEIL
ncbi:MAG: Crp/Fnr family transcriptional regulator [Oscillospiraceae bacterium]|nr:Crp/Fnr family transcriptional regulator [Oscillospiraceae bacterium]